MSTVLKRLFIYCMYFLNACVAQECRSLLQVAAATSCEFDHSSLDKVLHKFITSDHTVDGVTSSLIDYAGLLKSHDDLASLRSYVDSLKNFKPSCLTKNGKLAFWANAYNALIINLVLSDAEKDDGRLTASIKDLKGDRSSVWGRDAGIVGGETMTLEEVLTAASRVGDPRIHAAVNCASLSCPDIRAGAYDAENVSTQFNDQVSKWLHNPTKGAKAVDGGFLVSPIFEWHADDFPSLTSFLSVALSQPETSIKVVGYLDYNWKLNQKT